MHRTHIIGHRTISTTDAMTSPKIHHNDIPDSAEVRIGRTSQKDELNVSLEHHLLEVLNPLSSILPDDLAEQLSTFISSSSSLIPHSILLEISKWSRSPAGIEVLKSSSLDPQSYSMVSLLAGTRTSPEKKFPAYVAKDPEAERRQAANDRKAVSTVVNGVLSVAGTGFATWWASEHTGMQLEWV